MSVTSREIDEAFARAKAYEPFRPRVVGASYLPDDDVIVVQLADGSELRIPRKHLQGLEHASQAELAEISIVGAQSGLHWESLDVDHYVPAIIEGIFGTADWMRKLQEK